MDSTFKKPTRPSKIFDILFAYCPGLATLTDDVMNEPQVNDIRAALLLVDDDPEFLDSCIMALKNIPCDIIKAKSGHEALEQCQRHEFSAILLDVTMSDMDGFQTARLLRSQQRTAHTPIVFVTGQRQTVADQETGYSLGGIDYLLKPFGMCELQTKVQFFIELFCKTKALEQRNEEMEKANYSLKIEVAHRLSIEEELNKAHKELEQRVEERTEELAQTYKVLKESEGRFRQFFRASFEGLAVVHQGHVVDTNLRFLEMFNLESLQPVDPSIDDFFMPVSQAAIHLQLETPIPGVMQLHARRDNSGAFPVDVECRESYFKGVRCIVMALRDLTEKQRLEQQTLNLKETIHKSKEKINQLTGLLPICSSCKKIRDDQGYWVQIENYIRQNSDADFTHGICPDCVKALYPKYIADMLVNPRLES